MKDLFNFESYLRAAIPANAPIVVVGDETRVEEIHRQETVLKFPLEKRECPLVTDPLSDAVYHTYHARMDKEEKKYNNIERGKMLSEYDNCLNCLNRLGVHVSMDPSIEEIDNAVELYYGQELHEFEKLYKLANRFCVPTKPCQTGKRAHHQQTCKLVHFLQSKNQPQKLQLFQTLATMTDLAVITKDDRTVKGQVELWWILLRLSVNEISKFLTTFLTIKNKERMLNEEARQYRQLYESDESDDPSDADKDLDELTRKRKRKRYEKLRKSGKPCSIIKIRLLPQRFLVIDPIYGGKVVSELTDIS